MRPSRNPRAAQEAPKELQRPEKKPTKKNHNKCLLGKKCLKPAISFLRVFGSRDLPRDPQETQEPPKKHPKSSKGPKKKHQKKSR